VDVFAELFDPPLLHDRFERLENGTVVYGSIGCVDGVVSGEQLASSAHSGGLLALRYCILLWVWCAERK
jgi:hypothetical protein